MGAPHFIRVFSPDGVREIFEVLAYRTLNRSIVPKISDYKLEQNGLTRTWTVSRHHTRLLLQTQSAERPCLTCLIVSMFHRHCRYRGYERQGSEADSM